MTSRKHLIIFIALVSGLSLSAPVLACPLVGGLVDFNCDQAHKIVFTGDSIVYGTGDAGGKGGYVKRIAARYPQSEVVNLGFPGISSEALYRKLLRNFRRGSSNANVKKFANADLVIIDVGRNDYWEGLAPEATIRNLKRLVALIRQHLGKKYWGAPPVAVSNLLLTSRMVQRFFVRSVIDLMIAGNSSALPVLLRPDKLGTAILSGDGIHPSRRGYDRIANKIVNKYLVGPAQNASRLARPDSDGDGVYDFFEVHKYSTLPSEYDSDGDTYGDGDELFIYGTDPLDVTSVPEV